MTQKEKVETLFEITSNDLTTIKNHLDIIVKTLADLIQLYKNEVNLNLDSGEAYIETCYIERGSINNIKTLIVSNNTDSSN